MKDEKSKVHFIRNTRLNNTKGVCVFLARIANEVTLDRMALPKAKVLVLVCNALVAGLNQADLEVRLEELEKRVVEIKEENENE